MSEPKTLAECLDEARNGDEFGAVLGRLFTILEQQRDEEAQQ